MEGRLAFEALIRRMPRGFTVDPERCKRVMATNVAGYSHVPVRPLP